MTNEETAALHERARQELLGVHMAERNIKRSEAALEMLLNAMARSFGGYAGRLLDRTVQMDIDRRVRRVLATATGATDHPALRITFENDAARVAFVFEDTDEGRMQRYELGIKVYETLVNVLRGAL